MLRRGPIWTPNAPSRPFYLIRDARMVSALLARKRFRSVKTHHRVRAWSDFDRRFAARLLVLALCLFSLAGCASTACRTDAPMGWRNTPSASGGDHRDGRRDGVRSICLYQQAWHPQGHPRGVVVLVHGLRDHSARYAAFAERLVSDGYAVYAFDLRGHGRSGGGRVWVDDFEDYLRDLDQFVTEVRAAEPGVPLFLFGHSMGGAIVTLYTIERHPTLAGLVLSAPALAVGPEVTGFKRGATNFFSVIIPGLAVFSLDASGFSRDPAVRAADERDPLIEHGNGPARTASQLLHAIDRIQSHMSQIDVPVLALHGTADRITPPAGSAQLVARAHNPDRTLHTYPGVYHDLLHEPESAQITNDIVQWLNAHTQSDSIAPTSEAPSVSPAP